MGEGELTAIVAKWLRKLFKADQGYEIDADCRHYNDTDVIVYKRYKGEKKRVLQIEVKDATQNQYIGIAEAMDYNMSTASEEIPTFLTVPINAGAGKWKTWKLARDIYERYKVKIGVLAIDGQNVKVEYNPKRVKMPN